MSGFVSWEGYFLDLQGSGYSEQQENEQDCFLTATSIDLLLNGIVDGRVAISEDFQNQLPAQKMHFLARLAYIHTYVLVKVCHGSLILVRLLSVYSM